MMAKFTYSVILCCEYVKQLPGQIREYMYTYSLITHVHFIYETYTELGPFWVRGCRIGPMYPPACHKRRLIGGSLFAVGCDPCQWKRGSWLLS